jgi:hypothetical protein
MAGPGAFDVAGAGAIGAVTEGAVTGAVPGGAVPAGAVTEGAGRTCAGIGADTFGASGGGGAGPQDASAAASSSTKARTSRAKCRRIGLVDTTVGALRNRASARRLQWNAPLPHVARSQETTMQDRRVPYAEASPTPARLTMAGAP